MNKSITLTETNIKHFWEKVKVGEKDECWEWQAAPDPKGYGRLQLGETYARAHRVSWVLHFGPIPDGMNVLHKCDNRKCVNPNCLFLGTYDDNNKDRVKKGRSARGEKNHTAKLKETDIPKIKELLSKGITQREIGKMFGVSHTNIGAISRGTGWKHLDSK